MSPIILDLRVDDLAVAVRDDAIRSFETEEIVSKHSNLQYKKASEIMTSLFFAAHKDLRWVGVVIEQEELQKLATDRLIQICRYMPAKAVAMIAFHGYDDDPREVWHVPEVRAYVKKALIESPQILSRLELNERRMMRSCVLDLDGRFGGTRNTAYLTSTWEVIARTVGLDPWE